jgi:predicted TPR repeat methyltransferase
MANNNDSSGDLNADRRFQYALELIADKDFASALDLLTQTVELIPNWPPLWFTRGETLAHLEELELAKEAFQRAIVLDPSDRLGAKLRIAKITGVTTDTVMSPAFIAALFDQYAERFDEHLTKALHYRGPEIVFEALQSHCAETNRNFHFKRAADLGCGTGLMAEKLLYNVDVFSGVDLSEKMIRQAQKSGYYNETDCGDIVGFLSHKPRQSFDLLIAADVLVYISALTPLFEKASQGMTRNGLFAFTVQSKEGTDYQLGPDMRYHHSAEYIEKIAHKVGLKVARLNECVTRFDAGKPVPSLVVVLSVA